MVETFQHDFAGSYKDYLDSGRLVSIKKTIARLTGIRKSSMEAWEDLDININFDLHNWQPACRTLSLNLEAVPPMLTLNEELDHVDWSSMPYKNSYLLSENFNAELIQRSEDIDDSFARLLELDYHVHKQINYADLFLQADTLAPEAIKLEEFGHMEDRLRGLHQELKECPTPQLVSEISALVFNMHIAMGVRVKSYKRRHRTNRKKFLSIDAPISAGHKSISVQFILFKRYDDFSGSEEEPFVLLSEHNNFLHSKSSFDAPKKIDQKIRCFIKKPRQPPDHKRAPRISQDQGWDKMRQNGKISS